MEGVRQQMRHTLEMVDGTLLTGKNDLNGVTELLLVLEQHLTAASTRGDGLLERLLGVDGRDDNLVEPLISIYQTV